jgi:outer membrane murein-binding lipoprotein Lpp
MQTDYDILSRAKELYHNALAFFKENSVTIGSAAVMALMLYGCASHHEADRASVVPSPAREMRDTIDRRIHQDFGRQRIEHINHYVR